MVLDERTKELAQADVLQGEVQEEAADHGKTQSIMSIMSLSPRRHL
jgi:hypothetical protein